MFETAKALWVRWRASRRQYEVDRAVFRASGGMEQYARHRDGDLSTIAPNSGAGAGGVPGGDTGGGLGGT